MIKLPQLRIYTEYSSFELHIITEDLVHYKSNVNLSYWISTSDKVFPRRKKFLIRLRNRFGD